MCENNRERVNGLSMHLQNLITHQMAKYGEGTFFIHATGSISYKEVLNRALKISYFLSLKGLKKGDYLLLHHATTMDSILVFYATQLLGVVFVPLNYDSSYAACEEIIQKTQPKMYIGKYEFHKEHYELDFSEFNTILEKTEMDDDFIHTLPLILKEDASTVLFTSGTTGISKGVLLSHETLYKKAELFTQKYEWNESDILLSLGEIHSIDRLRNGCIAPLFIGNSVVLDEKNKKLFTDIANLIYQYRCTLTSFVPTLIRQFIRFFDEVDKNSLESLRFIGVPGNTLTMDEKVRFMELYNKKLLAYYGLSETGGLCTCVLPDEDVQKSYEGFPLECEMKIIDENEREVPHGIKGELIIKSRVPFMLGYLEDTMLTQAAIRDNWLYTSDIASIHPNGAVSIYARKGDVFKNINEELVYPSEIENLLRRHPLVKECAVFAYEGSFSETRIAAIIGSNIDKEDELGLFKELRQSCITLLGRQKTPSFYRIIEEFPMTLSGKIKRQELKKQFFTE